MARPSIINDALIGKFCSHIRLMGSIQTAISATGIGRETYYGWARRVGQGGGTELERKFIAAVERAEGETKMLVERMLQRHFDKSWRAIAWWLERRYPQEYARRRLPVLFAEEDPDRQPRPTRIVWEKAASARRAEAKPTRVSEQRPAEGVERVSGAWVPGTYYETLGLEPITGRFLGIDDDRPDAQPVAVITDSYWARRFGRDPKVIGQSLRIDSVAVTIVGVSPAKFNSPPGGQLADITMAVGLRPPVQLTTFEVTLDTPLPIVA